MDLKLEPRDRQDDTTAPRANGLPPVEAEKTRLPSFTSLISDRESFLPRYGSPSYRQQVSSAPRGASLHQMDGDNRRDQSLPQLPVSSTATMSSHQPNSRFGVAQEFGRERPRLDGIVHHHSIVSMANSSKQSQNGSSIPDYTTFRPRGRPASISDPMPAFDTLDAPPSQRSPLIGQAIMQRPQDDPRLQQASHLVPRVEAGANIRRSPGAPSLQAFHPHQSFAQSRYQDSRLVHTFESRRASFSPGAEEEVIFARLWNVMMTTMQYNDYPPGDANRSPPNARPMPQIREGDFAVLLSHIQYELDHLNRTEPQLAQELDYEVQSLQRQLDGIYRRNNELRHSRPTAYNRQSQRFSPYSRHAEVGGSGGVYRPPSEPFYPNNHADVMPQRSEVSDGRRFSYDARVNLDGTYARQEYQNGYRDDVHALVQQGAAVGSTATTIEHYGRPVSVVQFGLQPFGQAAYVSAAPPVPKRVRKRRDEVVQTCLSCSASETPEWRKGPTGPRTLCNACGLLYAKQCRKREIEAQQSLGKRAATKSRVGGPDRMTNEERENSLLELRMAVQARASQSAPTVGPIASTAQNQAFVERERPIEGGAHH